MPTSPAWVRLGREITARRIALGIPTTRALAGLTTLTERSVGKLENGGSVNRNTLAEVERVLQWGPGSALMILEGGDPVDRSPAGGSYGDPALQEIWDDTRLPDDEKRAMISLALQMRAARQGDGEKPA